MYIKLTYKHNPLQQHQTWLLDTPYARGLLPEEVHLETTQAKVLKFKI